MLDAVYYRSENAEETLLPIPKLGESSSNILSLPEKEIPVERKIITSVIKDLTYGRVIQKKLPEARQAGRTTSTFRNVAEIKPVQTAADMPVAKNPVKEEPVPSPEPSCNAAPSTVSPSSTEQVNDEVKDANCDPKKSGPKKFVIPKLKKEKIIPEKSPDSKPSSASSQTRRSSVSATGGKRSSQGTRGSEPDAEKVVQPRRFSYSQYSIQVPKKSRGESRSRAGSAERAETGSSSGSVYSKRYVTKADDRGRRSQSDAAGKSEDIKVEAVSLDDLEMAMEEIHSESSSKENSPSSTPIKKKKELSESEKKRISEEHRSVEEQERTTKRRKTGGGESDLHPCPICDERFEDQSGARLHAIRHFEVRDKKNEGMFLHVCSD